MERQETTPTSVNHPSSKPTDADPVIVKCEGEVPVGPALPENAHQCPGSPLYDPAREIQMEFEEQQEHGKLFP